MSAESINEWIIIYRAYSPDQITCEQARLQKWLSNPYDAQTQGSKSYQRARSEIVSQLAALQRVLNETRGQPCIGQMDASCGIWPSAATNGIGANGYPDSWNG